MTARVIVKHFFRPEGSPGHRRAAAGADRAEGAAKACQEKTFWRINSADGVYIDLSFFSDLERRFGAPGDFAQAYVVAHEVGHHVQNLLGVSAKVRELQRQASREEANALSVRLELQADCLAGIWGHDAGRDSDLLEPGDVEEGLSAAAAIGDD